MKVLLVNPPLENMIRPELPLPVKENEGIFAPLGLLYIASYLQKAIRCDVGILDAPAQQVGYRGIFDYVREFRPDVAGITACTHTLIDVIKVAETIKAASAKTHISVGGPHADCFPRETAGFSCIDSCVVGEGEVTFTELVSSLRDGAGIEKVRGLFFRDNGRVIETGSREAIEDLDSLPFPARRLLPLGRYYGILGRRPVMATMVSSRGCPYHCSFCSTPKGGYRMRSARNVAEEMEECLRMGIREIHFFDDTFNADPGRTAELCEEIMTRKMNVVWSFRGRVDRLTKDLLKKLKSAGCYRIHLGVETCSDEGLKRLGKGITIDQAREVFGWTRSLGISTVAYFLIGCPHETTRKHVLDTISFSKELDPDFALFNILTPYPKTELYEEGIRKGLFGEDYWRGFALSAREDFQLPFWKEHLSAVELVELSRRAYREFYLRPRFVFRMLAQPQGWRMLSRKFKTGMAFMKEFSRHAR